MGLILEKTFIFLILIVIGCVLRHKKFFKEEDFSSIAKIVFNFTIPCAIISSFSQLKIDFSFFYLILIGIAANIILIIFGILFSKRGNSSEKSFNIINYSGFNFGGFSLPYVQSFFSPSALVASCMVDAGNAFFCSGGNYAIAKISQKKSEKMRFRNILKSLFLSIPIDAYILMILVSILGIKLPSFILTFTDTVAQANPFLSMIMVGVGLKLSFSKETFFKSLKILSIRFIICAILAYLCFAFLPFNRETNFAVALFLFSPITSLNIIFTKNIDGDTKLSAQTITLSMILSSLIMTIMIPLFNTL